MNGSSLALVLASSLAAVAVAQQPSTDATQKNIMVVGEPAHAIDAKKAKVGDKVVLRLQNHIRSNGKIVVPFTKGSVIGHISRVQPPTKENGGH